MTKPSNLRHLHENRPTRCGKTSSSILNGSRCSSWFSTRPRFSSPSYHGVSGLPSSGTPMQRSWATMDGLLEWYAASNRLPKQQAQALTGWRFQFFLSIPAWIYLMMAPRFPRTRKIAQPHAMVAVDALFAVIWLSAFATQAAYNSAGLCGTACHLSKAVVAMAVFVWYVSRRPPPFSWKPPLTPPRTASSSA